MLDELVLDLNELLELVRATERYEAVLFDRREQGKPIKLGEGADEEFKRKRARILKLTAKWGLK